MSILAVEHLTKTYKEKKAVDDVSFLLEQGKCTALLGPNGAGKTTTLNLISGLIKASSGMVTSEKVAKKNDLRQLIGYLPQFPAFFDWMSGEEYLKFSGELTSINRNELAIRVDELIELVGLAEGRKRRIGQYSGGMRQRLGIAQALIHQPQLIILDEPVSALDPFGRREVLDLMKRLKKETTILFSTHILNDAEEVCDDVIFMHEGKLIESGSLKTVKERHSLNMIRLVFETNPDDFMIHLKGEKWIKSMEVQDHSLLIKATNSVVAREQLLHILAKRKVPLLKFEMRELSLEEIFVKVVKM